MSARITLLATIGLLTTACASTPDPWNPKVMQYDGAQLFSTYCARCHGASGEGNRAVSSEMVNFSVPNLTLIKYEAGGTFPREEVRKIISGTSPRPSHTSRTMPIWAWKFYNTKSPDPTAERERVEILIDRLVNHIESLQHDPG